MIPPRSKEYASWDGGLLRRSLQEESCSEAFPPLLAFCIGGPSCKWRRRALLRGAERLCCTGTLRGLRARSGEALFRRVPHRSGALAFLLRPGRSFARSDLAGGAAIRPVPPRRGPRRHGRASKPARSRHNGARRGTFRGKCSQLPPFPGNRLPFSVILLLCTNAIRTNYKRGVAKSLSSMVKSGIVLGASRSQPSPAKRDRLSWRLQTDERGEKDVF